MESENKEASSNQGNITRKKTRSHYKKKKDNNNSTQNHSLPSNSTRITTNKSGSSNGRGRNDKKTYEKKNNQNTKNTAPSITTASTITASSLSNEGKIEASCIICCDPLIWYAVGKCNHRGMCALCSIRRRVLYNDQKCPICMVRDLHWLTDLLY